MPCVFGEQVAGEQVIVLLAIRARIGFYPKKIFYLSGLTTLKALSLIQSSYVLLYVINNLSRLPFKQLEVNGHE
jgi:hypothetical protein